MTKKWVAAILLALAFLEWPALPAHAEVVTTPQTAGSVGQIFVAGNPDFYPIEYYDAESKQYCGVLPRLLEQFSEQTGVDFVYIAAGKEDKRLQLAENAQVELVSGCTSEEDLGNRINGELFVFTMELDGTEQQVGFYCTQLATDALQTQLRDFLQQVDEETLMQLTLQAAYEGGRLPTSKWVWGCVGLVGLLLLAEAGWLTYKVRCIRKRNAEERLIDPETGLGNREYFLQEYKLLLNEKVRSLYTLFFFGVDPAFLEQCCDGSDRADLIRYAAEMFAENVGDNDLLARVTVGGFAVAHQCTSREDALAFADRALEKLNTQINRSFGTISATFAVGIYPLSRDDASANHALSAAQEGYRFAHQRALPYGYCDDVLLGERDKERTLLRDAKYAINAKEILCYLQSAVHTKDGSLAGVEVFSRWQHAERGLLKPSAYLKEMEQSDSIVALDLYMFEQACRIQKLLEQKGRANIIVSLNLSAKTLQTNELAANLREIAENQNASLCRICLEFPEKSLANPSEAFSANLRQCHAAGLKIALDHVGCGGLSFEGLLQYSIDLVKMDRTLLLSITQEDGRRLLEQGLAFFHQIGIKTLCEGIETEQQFTAAQAMGFDFAQGYYIQRVLPEKEALRCLDETN